MRRLKRGRLIKMVAATIIIMLVVAGVVVYFFSPVDPAYILDFVTSQGYVKGHTEYCEHSITYNRRLRIVFTPYANPAAEGRHQIDPNDWKNEPLAHDFMTMQIIVIPDVDYEITVDAGQSWKNFWHFQNQGNDGPWCDAFDSLDADNFWVWTRNRIAITHDGGNDWIIQDGFETIQGVEFDTPEKGQINFVFSDPTLLTTDGGRTWQPDPNWTAPTE